MTDASNATASCVAIEDSHWGLEAARKAGSMRGGDAHLPGRRARATPISSSIGSANHRPASAEEA